MIWLRRIFLLLVALAIGQIFYYYPQMPDVVASHFDGLGAPNDWSSKTGFFTLCAVILALLVAAFMFMPGWAEKRGSFGMKIPNRDYWLAPERVEQTKAFFRRQMMLMGIIHLCLAIYAIQLAILANFSEHPRLHPSIGWALTSYFAFLAVWLIHFYMHFRKP